jgi:hypothetical protein
MNVQRNIEILSAKDCAYLSILDTSFYPIPVDTANLTVTVPGYDTPFEFEFTLGEVNILNSYSFGFTTSETSDFAPLPDGVYILNLTTCPDTGECTRYHLRTCKINCRLAEQWAQYIDCMTCSENEMVLKELDRIEFLLKGAEAHADLCNPAKARELYIKADDLLRRVEGNC